MITESVADCDQSDCSSEFITDPRQVVREMEALADALYLVISRLACGLVAELEKTGMTHEQAIARVLADYGVNAEDGEGGR